MRLLRHAADQLTGSHDRRSPQYLAALGLMLLRGVTAASNAGDRATTKDLLSEAPGYRALRIAESAAAGGMSLMVIAAACRTRPAPVPRSACAAP